MKLEQKEKNISLPLKSDLYKIRIHIFFPETQIGDRTCLKLSNYALIVDKEHFLRQLKIMEK